MTNEEAIKQLLDAEHCLAGHGDLWDVDMEAFEMAIKALKQNNTLDKIRAEIEELPTKTRINWDGVCPDPDYPEIEYIDVTKKQLLQIIDKQKVRIKND